MGQIVVRKLDDAVLDAGISRALAINRSTEAKVRAILETVVGLAPNGSEIADGQRRNLRDFVSNDRRLGSASRLDFRLWSQLDQW